MIATENGRGFKHVKRTGNGSPDRPGTTADGQGMMIHGLRLALVIMVIAFVSGCAAAIGAASAAGEIRRGIAGLQQLVDQPDDSAEVQVRLPATVDAPIAGTYRGFQALGRDTLWYYLRTAPRPIAVIADSAGTVTGYALHGIAAVALDTLERRVAELTRLDGEDPQGRMVFFVEGTHPPSMTGRSLYPAAFLGRPTASESAVARRQEAALRATGLTMEAPEFDTLRGQAIPHEQFGSVAEGIFTLRADDAAVYEQEHQLEDGETFILRFERISRTTLP